MRHPLVILLLILFYNGLVVAGESNFMQVSKAIRADNPKLVSSLVKSGADINKIPMGQGMSLLGLAVYFNREEIVHILINSGANVIDVKGNNILVMACATNKRNKNIIEALLKSGVSIDSVNKKNQNCLYSATISADSEFFSYLINKGANPNLVVTPNPVIASSSMSIEELVDKRIESYSVIKNRITRKSSGGKKTPR